MINRLVGNVRGCALPGAQGRYGGAAGNFEPVKKEKHAVDTNPHAIQPHEGEMKEETLKKD